MLNFSGLHKIIEENKSFLITTHVNPDGDAIGSQIALYKYLNRLGKELRLINFSETPSNLQFLDPESIIENYQTSSMLNIFEQYDVLIAVDFNRLDRIIDMEDGFRKSSKIKVCIDHHEDSEQFTEFMFVDTSYGSTGEILFDLIDSYKEINIDYEIALPLYVAIMTDSGSFKYERTLPATHLKAARLLGAGVDPKETHRLVFENVKPGKIKLLGKALNSLTLYHDGRVALMKINRADLNETGTGEEDTDGFVNYALSVEDVKIALLLYELQEGLKVSFRSVGDIPVNKLAEEFGGGGHFHAAGARITDNTAEAVLPKIIELSKKYLD
ncbi:MAG: DHH family phosphoesterase [Melioribacteraceae bacterium]|nr:DHH family phosphoesterase [Melioribacteraceae bacterium]